MGKDWQKFLSLPKQPISLSTDAIPDNQPVRTDMQFNQTCTQYKCDIYSHVRITFSAILYTHITPAWTFLYQHRCPSWHYIETMHNQVGTKTVIMIFTATYVQLMVPMANTHTHTHIHVTPTLCTDYKQPLLQLLQPFNSLFSRTTWVSRYQEGKTNLDFTAARDSEWQWHQLGHMQVCTSLQTDNHASTPPICFLAGCPSCRPTNSVKALKAQTTEGTNNHYTKHNT